MRGFEFLKLKIQINFLGVRLPRFLLLYWSVLLGSQRYVQQKQKKYCALTVTLFLCFSFSSAQVDFCPETCSGELYCLYFMVPCQLTSYRFCLKIFYLDCKKANLSANRIKNNWLRSSGGGWGHDRRLYRDRGECVQPGDHSPAATARKWGTQTQSGSLQQVGTEFFPSPLPPADPIPPLHSPTHAHFILVLGYLYSYNFAI